MKPQTDSLRIIFKENDLIEFKQTYPNLEIVIDRSEPCVFGIYSSCFG